jgi:hypothetical protein
MKLHVYCEINKGRIQYAPTKVLFSNTYHSIVSVFAHVYVCINFCTPENLFPIFYIIIMCYRQIIFYHYHCLWSIARPKNKD